MLDNDSTPVTIQGRSITDQLRERMANRPDQWTLAWWKSQFDELLKAYRGACHSINLAVGNTREHAEILMQFGERVATVEQENRLLQARLGEMQAENSAMLKRIDDMAAWAAKQGRKDSAK